MARHLAARAGSGASHRNAAAGHLGHLESPPVGQKLESPCRNPGVRASLKRSGDGDFRQTPAPVRSADRRRPGRDLRLTAVQPRKRGGGIETPEQAAESGEVLTLALVAVLSDAGLPPLRGGVP